MMNECCIVECENAAPGAEAGAYEGVCFDMLTPSSMSLFKLVPDGSGRLTIPLSGIPFLRFGGQLTVFCDHPDLVLKKTFWLDSKTAEHPFRDRRVKHEFDASNHYAFSREMLAGRHLTVQKEGQMRIVSTLGEVVQIVKAYSSLSETELTPFKSLLSWSSLDAAAKAEQYSKMACHEVNFFLSRHDRPFFEAVVRPFLANVLRPSFVDEYLLGRDLSKYCHLSLFQNLNAFEQCLLLSTLSGERGANLLAHIRDRVKNAPLAPASLDRLYQTVLSVGVAPL